MFDKIIFSNKLDLFCTTSVNSEYLIVSGQIKLEDEQSFDLNSNKFNLC